MAIYALPDEFQKAVPEWTGDSYDEHMVREKTFCNKLAECLRNRNPSDSLVGEIMRWPVADGYAEYMVAATKPVQLLHLPLGDAWHYPLAHRATKKDIVNHLGRVRAMDRLFGKE
jgi:hypothetical protein